MQIVKTLNYKNPVGIQEWQKVLYFVCIVVFGLAYFIKLPSANPFAFLIPGYAICFFVYLIGNWLIEKQSYFIKKEYRPTRIHHNMLIVYAFYVIVCTAVPTIQQEAIDNIIAIFLCAFSIGAVAIYIGSFRRTMVNEEGILIDNKYYPWQEIRNSHWDDYECQLNIDIAYQIKPLKINLSKKEADEVVDIIKKHNAMVS